MANLKEIRNRISSVESTMQITSAMKMVSAAKLKRAQDAIVQLRPYAEQENLFYIPESRDMEISRAVETIRRKHGIGIIKKANVLHALG